MGVEVAALTPRATAEQRVEREAATRDAQRTQQEPLETRIHAHRRCGLSAADSRERDSSEREARAIERRVCVRETRARESLERQGVSRDRDASDSWGL